MSKGKRELIFEIGALQTDAAELKKIIEESLKLQGVKGGEAVKMYYNTKEGIVYCVTGTNKVYEVKLCL